MKTTIKRVVSIIVILCLTLTMMPGMTWTSYADTEEPYHYESSLKFDGMTQKLLPKGGTLTAYTGLTAYYDWGYDYPQYDMNVTLIPDEGVSEDLITYEIDENVITFTSNDRGETGYMELIIEFVVNGETVGSMDTSISVSDTVYRWPNSLSDINSEYRDNPLVGDVIDLKDISVEKLTYDESTGEVESTTITTASERMQFSQGIEWGWSPVDDSVTEGLFPAVRTESGDVRINVYLYEAYENGEFGYIVSEAYYDFESLDYSINMDTPIEAYESETSKDIEIYKSSLADKENAQVVVKVGYTKQEGEDSVFVPFENQSELFTSSESEDSVIVTINPSKLSELDAEGGELCIKATVVASSDAGTFEIYDRQETIYLMESAEEYTLDLTKEMLKGATATIYPVGLYIKNAEYPDGKYDEVAITAVEILSGENEVIKIEYVGDTRHVIATGYGTAEIKVTHETFDGGTAEILHTIKVVEKSYNANLGYVKDPIYGTDGSFVIPGVLGRTFDLDVNCESEENYETDVPVDLEFELEDSSFEPYITFTAGENGCFTVNASADAPVGDDYTFVEFTVKAFIDGEEVARESAGVRLTKEECYIDLEGFDENTDIGESCTVTPKLKKLYLDENGDLKTEELDVFKWSYDYSDDYDMQITDNGDGTYTIRRSVTYGTGFNFSAYLEGDGEYVADAYFGFAGLNYNYDLEYEKDYVQEGETATVTAVNNDGELKDNLKFEWTIGYYDDTNEAANDEGFVEISKDAGHYTISGDGKSVVLNGTALYNADVININVMCRMYIEIDGREETLAFCEKNISVYSEDEELYDPDTFSADELLAMADENGVIVLENSVILLDTLVIDDGKTYTLDLNGEELACTEGVDTLVKVTNGTLNVKSSSIDEKYGYPREGWIVCEDGNTIVIDGTKDTAAVNLGEYVNIEGNVPVTVTSGTFSSEAIIRSWTTENEIVVGNADDVSITLTGGWFRIDYSEYIPDTHTKLMDAYYDFDGEEETLKGREYKIIKTPASVDEAVLNDILYIGEDGYYYASQKAADDLGVKVQKLGFWIYLTITDEKGDYVHDGKVYFYDFVGKVGMTIPEIFEFNGSKLELPEIEGYHFSGWYIYDEDNDYTQVGEDEYLLIPSGDRKYGNDEPIYDAVDLATKWCNSTETKVVGYVEATPTTEGYTGDTVCAECGCVIEKGEVTKPTASCSHTWDEGKITTAATCMTEGEKTFTCTLGCGETYTEVVEKLTTHSYDAGKVTKAPTCTATGVKTYTCTVAGCGATKTETIAKAAHSYSSSYTVDKKATLSENGSKSKHCTKCSAKTSVTSIPKVSSVSLSSTAYTYNGKTKTPTVTVKDSKGKTLKNGTDYSVSYASGRKKIDKYKVTVTLKGAYSGSKNLYFTIGPKNPKTVKTVLYGYNDVKVSWSKVSGVTKYQVYYKKSSASSYKLLKTTSSTSYKKSNLSDGVKYDFKVVAYKTTGGDKCYNAGKTSSITTLKKVTGVKAADSGSKVKVSWTNIGGETGYQISKSTSKSKTNVVATYKTTSGKSKTISATKGKTYYYKVRAYKVVSGKKIYGPWSSVVKYKRGSSSVTASTSTGEVWIPKTGSKYHSKSTCSNMVNPRKSTLAEAKELGLEPCSRCH